MRKADFVLTAKKEIAKDIFMLTLSGDTSDIRAGQFVNIATPTKYLRRPISVCDVADGRLTLVIRTQGEGTHSICSAGLGGVFNLLVGLGNGFDTNKHGQHNIIVGGGIGVPPLFLLARQMLASHIVPEVILGFVSKEQAILVDQFRELSLFVTVCTDDGSLGRKGNVCDMLCQSEADYIYACGPRAMLAAIAKTNKNVKGQFCVEERMGCGVGICMGCTCQTKNGAKLVCTDGPVFEADVLKW